MNFPFNTSNYLAQAELTRRNAEIGRQEIDEVSAANEAAASRVNMAAMASSRRRAGGTTFRRRGSGVSANQLVSGLGAANASARAAKRRELAQQEVNAGLGWLPNKRPGVRNAPVITLYH